jgi:hypothetical protein
MKSRGALIVALLSRTWILVGCFVFAGCCCDADSVSGFTLWAEVYASSDYGTTVGVWASRCSGDEFSDQVFDTGCGDRFIATAAGEREVLDPSSGGRYDFETTFDATAEGTEFRVSFDRPNASAPPDVVGALPAPFEFSGTIPTEASRESDILIEWAPSGSDDLMYLTAGEPDEEGCLFGSYASLPISDSGSHVVPAGSLEFLLSDTDTCEVVVQLDRYRTVDQGCGGFEMHIGQSRTFAFVLTR